MLVHEGATRSIGTDLRLGCTLAAAAGAVNVAGFLAVGYYTANMTGNLSALAVGVGDRGMVSVLSCMGVLVAFATGGCIAALLVGMGRRRGVRAVHAASIVLEGTLLIALGILSRALPAWMEAGGLGCGLGFLMGLQNATVTHISGARVRTTHMTGMLTDLGMELGQWLLDPDAARVRERLRLHGAIIACFVLGGIMGGAGYRMYGMGVLIFMGSGLVLLAVPGLWRAMRHR
ncbi:YoaK family protein [Komagataeibacter diospyri]|uniref:YoaK family protein n=1 Tax=Komagataeibacter diospyri TaxID=1932662 RepID=UPI001143C0A1|nr:YoaK family protein [Komagataeibacter diospyri]